MSWVQFLNDPLWNFLVVLLVAVGVFYIFVTGAVQLRLFLHSIRVMKGSRKERRMNMALHHFRLLSLGLQAVWAWVMLLVLHCNRNWCPWCRVFWMWVTAFLGMSSAFVESSLAQLFKVKDHQNKRFRGGPAYYITKGLKQKWLGIVLHCHFSGLWLCI